MAPNTRTSELTGMHVSALWRYPVKSVGGEQVATATISELGIQGDRSWGIRDNATGNILTGRRAAPLLLATARLVDTGVLITMPDGTETADDAVLSAWLGSDVSLIAAGPDQGGTFENPMNAEEESDWMSWTGPSGAFHDSGRTRVSLLGEATAAGWDLRRFRANVILAGGTPGEEDDLVGRSIGVGSVQLDVVKQIDRCVMVSRPLPGIERDLGILKTINSERNSMLAVGSVVTHPGEIAVGDPVHIHAPQPQPGNPA